MLPKASKILLKIIIYLTKALSSIKNNCKVHLNPDNPINVALVYPYHNY